MLLEKNHFFDPFRPEVRKKLIKLAQVNAFEEDTPLFNEDDPADVIYLVLDGQVQLIKRSESGAEEFIASVGPGEYFGEVAILDGSGRSTAAKATAGTALATIPADPLLELLNTEPGEVSMKLFRRITGHLRATNERFMNEVVHKEKMTLVGEMASLIIHDFKSPINGILLAIELIGKKHDDDMTTKFTGLIRQQSHRMMNMAQELLEFSSGTPQLAHEAVSVATLFERFTELYGHEIEAANIDFEVNPCDAVVMADPNRLQRVLQNLAGNALDVLRDRPGGRLELSAETCELESGDASKSGVCLKVIDNGPGIPEKVRSTLFEPFVTHGKAKGTGLGLAIAQTFVQAHGGHITFETAEGKGTTFLVTLPLKSNAPTKAPKEMATAKS